MIPGEVRSFYDEFSRGLLVGYVHGNPRVEAAITHAIRWIPPRARRILDVGCGIGWSTWEIKRHFPKATVVGVDLSPRMIEIARKLFETDGLVFITHDITNPFKVFELFDVIVMLDVYEHIPKQLRQTVHQILKELLAPDGMLILTFPSVFYQAFLREHRPEALQPVDEDVTVEDVELLARDLDAKVIFWSYVNIWRERDYVHAVVKRGKKIVAPPARRAMDLEPKHVRITRVMRSLKVRVTRHGVLIPSQGKYTVCIVSPNKDAYSETFIRAHIERLPARVRVLYGGRFPKYTDDDRPLLQPSFGRWMVRYFLQRAFRLPADYFQKKAFVDFLKKHKVSVVLAEYGPTGAEVMDACVKAGVPLVVHFHGFDASHKPTLERYHDLYKRMFGIAEAIVVVSRDMEKKLLELGAPREKLFYNPYGVDTSLFKGGDPGSAPPVFVAVGRFVEKKAPHLTLLAFWKVLKECPEAKLVMVGDGELWGACRLMAKALGIEHAVEFLGVRSHAEVALIMRGARAFVQHSITATNGDSEGTPVAVLEAGATGLPVVSTRHAGIKDVVVDGETGFLVDEGDIEGMARRMIQLAKDPHLAAEMGRKARERICGEFSMEKSIVNLWRIIESVIKRNAG